MTAIPAIAIHPAHPGNADARAHGRFRAFACDNFADDLMAGDELWPQRRQVAFDDVQIGAADAAGEDAKEQMTGDELRARNFFDRQRRC